MGYHKAGQVFMLSNVAEQLNYIETLYMADMQKKRVISVKKYLYF